MGSSISPSLSSRELEMPSYYTNQAITSCDRNNCAATWRLISSSMNQGRSPRGSGESRFGLLQYFLDVRLGECLPEVAYMHISGVVTLMLTRVLGPQTFWLNEGDAESASVIATTIQLLHSSGIGKNDLFYFGSSLFSALKSVCGDFYDDEVNMSWKRYYSFLLRNLLVSANEESTFLESMATLRVVVSPKSVIAPRGFKSPVESAEGIQQFYTRMENCVFLDEPSSP